MDLDHSQASGVFSPLRQTRLARSSQSTSGRPDGAADPLNCGPRQHG
jgi:hypothetical protein